MEFSEYLQGDRMVPFVCATLYNFRYTVSPEFFYIIGLFAVLM